MSILTQSESNSSGAVPIGAVPDNSAQMDTASLGLQIQQKILHNQQLDQAIAQTLPAALTPVPTQGQASAKLPSGLNYNVVQPNFAPAQGHTDARNKGIASVVVGSANIVGQIAKKRQEEKQRILAVDIERIMGAQDAISQAQATLKSDPNNKDAQALIDKNRQIINDTASDPKKQKQLEKAFDLSLDPSKHTPENDALKMAKKSFAQKLEAATPTKMVPNAAAQAKLQAFSAQRAANDEELKALAPIYNQQQRDAEALRRVQIQQQEADNRTQYQQQHADMRKAADVEESDKKIDAMLQEGRERNATAITTTGMRESGAADRTLANIASREKVAKELRGSKPEIAAKLEAQNAAQMNKLLESSAQIISNNETLKKTWKGDTSKIDETINRAKQNQKLASSYLEQYTIRMNAMMHGAELDPQKPAKPADQKGDSKDGSSKQSGSTPSASSTADSKVVQWLLGGNEGDDSSGDDGTDPDSIN